MIGKLIDVLGVVLGFLNKLTDVINYILTGYAKAEAKKDELAESADKFTKILLISVLSGGAALIVFFIVKAIVKKIKKIKANRVQREIEQQQELQMN